MSPSLPSRSGSDPHAYWQRLLATASVGTERQSLPTLEGDKLLTVMLSILPNEDNETRLMAAAGTLTLYRKAGHVPAEASNAEISAAPEDLQGRCGTEAAHRLRRLLGGEYRELLPEWLALCAQAGLRVSEEILPTLLDVAAKGIVSPDAIRLVIGERGIWLADQNEDWRFARQSALDGRIWETGSREERLAYLQALREQDPDTARSLLAATWAAESPDDRARFLPVFQTGLSMADEPFLEATLDDKRKDVRKAAADLLARLPDSRLVARMVERLRPLLTVSEQKALLGLGPRKLQISVTLPEACDKAMIHDGIEPKPSYGTGEKAWWLQQMIAALPLSFWTETWGGGPAEWFDAAKRSDWKDALMTGWIQSTMRNHEEAWAAALLIHAYENARNYTLLREVLSPERAETVFLHYLNTNGKRLQGKRCLPLLLQLEHPWSLTFTQTFLESLDEMLRSEDRESERQFLWNLPSITRHFHPDALSAALVYLSRWLETRPDEAATLRKIFDSIQFRHDMHREFAP